MCRMWGQWLGTWDGYLGWIPGMDTWNGYLDVHLAGRIPRMARLRRKWEGLK